MTVSLGPLQELEVGLRTEPKLLLFDYVCVYICICVFVYLCIYLTAVPSVQPAGRWAPQLHSWQLPQLP